MLYKTLLTLNSALAVVMGAACVLIPGRLLANYGVSLVPMGLVIYQFWGTTLIGLGLLAWFMRGIKDTRLKRAIALSLLITNGLSCIMAVRGQYAGANDFGWSTVVLFLFFALGFTVTIAQQLITSDTQIAEQEESIEEELAETALSN